MKNNTPPAIKTILEKLLSSPEISAMLTPPPPREEVEKRYLTLPEAVHYSGLQRWTLWRFSRAGKLPVIKTSRCRAGQILYEKSDIDKLLKSLKKG